MSCCGSHFNEERCKLLCLLLGKNSRLMLHIPSELKILQEFHYRWAVLIGEHYRQLSNVSICVLDF